VEHLQQAFPCRRTIRVTQDSSYKLTIIFSKSPSKRQNALGQQVTSRQPDQLDSVQQLEELKAPPPLAQYIEQLILVQYSVHVEVPSYESCQFFRCEKPPEICY